MDNLLINKTAKTPDIKFDVASGLLEIEGRLIPENPDELFEVLFNALDAFNNNSKNVIRLFLHYYNTTSAKRLLLFFQKADAMFQNGCKIKIVWEYEEGDDDSLRDGEDYKSLLKVPFEIKLV